MSLSKRAIPVVAAAAALVVCTATAAGATSVIGFGNGTHDNRCANHGSTYTVNSVRHTAGSLVAGVLAFSLSAPANQCGDLGLPKEDKVDQPAENFHVDVAE
ncbi:hypothetical protein EASAB2608_08271 [Streptomyces sp. EAS-AB2608]|uniref:DUF320 domain-containing protein n=1 Tax=Streptomyces bangladeshensis TaxID=295352 RepID=A0ABN3BNM3_9ACTN|nr:hypothetical protein EASAB2608_08271 [Streptomyces sp. EAS-AB2608]CUW33215.1 hypothetical protein TUE45_pSRTUE45c_0583 [Streptomyces reticuli]